MLYTVSSFALFKKRRLERNRDIIDSAIQELELFDCGFIAHMLESKLDHNVWRKCGLFSDCEQLVRQHIAKARKLCSLK